jgi:hypothetical protein
MKLAEFLALFYFIIVTAFAVYGVYDYITQP